jgi:hypothetical protein
MSRARATLTLAFVLTALLIVGLPRVARAGANAPPADPARVAAVTVPAGGGADASSGALCRLPGLVRADGTPCPVSRRARRQLLGLPDPAHLLPNPAQVITKIAGGVTGSVRSFALKLIVGWVASGAESALKGTAKVIDETTSPELTSSWFSASYWRIAGIATLLTLPFLCAAAIHALVRSELTLLTRAAFGYLPLSLLAVGITSQLTMLLLSATDEMSAIVASASGHADAEFLSHAAVTAIAASVTATDPFIVFIAAIATVAATLALWVELLIRDAAVYVIVLMLPLFFAAMVWPARRTLVIRALETLIALILSKFAIVAVLALGGTALGHSSAPGPAAVLTGATLVLLAAFAPWALLRVLPLHEVASAAAGGLSQAPAQAVPVAMERTMRGVALGAGVGAGAAEWIRPRLAPEGRPSLLDGSRLRDAHRSAMGAESPADAGSAGTTAGAGADASLEESGPDGVTGVGVDDPVTPAMAHGGSAGPDRERGDGPSGTHRPSAAPSVSPGAATVDAASPPAGAEDPPTRTADARDDGTAESPPFFDLPDEFELGPGIAALIDRNRPGDGGATRAAGQPAGADDPAPPSVVEPPLLPEHDPLARPTSAPPHDRPDDPPAGA